MLKIFPALVAIAILLSACKAAPNSITVRKASFTAQIEVLYEDKQYYYKLRYNNSGKCEFIPQNTTVPIKFSYKNGRWNSLNNEMNFEFSNHEFLVPAIIKSVIDNTKGRVITPNYNEKYCHYGSSAIGEYQAEFNSSGNITKISVGNTLHCEFKNGG